MLVFFSIVCHGSNAKCLAESVSTINTCGINMLTSCFFVFSNYVKRSFLTALMGGKLL